MILKSKNLFLIQVFNYIQSFPYLSDQLTLYENIHKVIEKKAGRGGLTIFLFFCRNYIFLKIRLND